MTHVGASKWVDLRSRYIKHLQEALDQGTWRFVHSTLSALSDFSSKEPYPLISEFYNRAKALTVWQHLLLPQWPNWRLSPCQSLSRSNDALETLLPETKLTLSRYTLGSGSDVDLEWSTNGRGVTMMMGCSSWWGSCVVRGLSGGLSCQGKRYCGHVGGLKAFALHCRDKQQNHTRSSRGRRSMLTIADDRALRTRVYNVQSRRVGVPSTHWHQLNWWSWSSLHHNRITTATS